MADVGTIAGAEVAPVQIIEQFTAPAGEVISPGTVVRLDAATGKFVAAAGTVAASSMGVVGVAMGSANAANITITAMRKGIMDLGTALSPVNYGQTIYLSNTLGVMGTAAGSVSVTVGNVVSNFAAGTAPDRLLHVNL